MKRKLFSLIALAAMMLGAQGAWADSETITSVATQSSTTRLGSTGNYHSAASLELSKVDDPTSTTAGFYTLLHFDVSAIKAQVETGKVVTDAKLRLTHYRNKYSNITISVKEVDGAWASTPAHRDNLKTYAAAAVSNPVLSSATVSFAKDMGSQLSAGTITTNNTLTDYQATIDLTDYIASQGSASVIDIMIYQTSVDKSKVWSVDASSSNMGDTEYSDNWETLLSAFGFANDAELIAAVAPALVVEVATPNNVVTSTSTAIADIHVRKGSPDNKYNEAYVQMWNKSESDKAFGFYAFNLPDDVANNPELTTVTGASLRLVSRQIKNSVSKTRFISIYGYGNNFVEGTSTYNTESSYITSALEAGNVAEFEAKGDRSNKTLGTANISDANYQTLADWTNTIDLTSHVAANATTQRMNLVLIQTTEDSGGNELNFFSRTCPNSIDLKNGDGTTLHTYAKADIEPQLTVTYSVGYTLTVTAAGMSTLVLPFQSVIPSGVTLYTLTTDGATITATEVTGTTLAANTPVLVVAEAGDYVFNATNTTIDKQIAVSGALTGVYTTTTAEEGCYVLQKHGDNAAAFYKLTSSSNKTVNPYRAYLTAPAAARELTIMFGENMTTGVTNVRGKMEDVRSDYFDLQGRRVVQPTKGLYIKNGKKYMVK